MEIRIGGISNSVILMLVFLTVSSFADEREGNELYKNEKFAEAAEEYKNASIEKPEDERINYNLGNAYYRLGSTEEAAKEYSRAGAAEDPGLSQRSFYNLGNSLFQAGQYEQAKQAYIKSLQFNPDDMEAKHNLEVTLEKIQEQQQQQQQQNQENQDKQEKQQNQEQNQQQEQKQDKERQQQQQEQDKQEQDPQQNRKQKQEQQKQEEQQQLQQPQQGKMSREDALRILNALQDDEKEVQKQIQRYFGKPRKVEKDW